MSNSFAIKPEDLENAEHLVLESMPGEHVNLADEPSADDQPHTVSERFELHDLARGIVIELTLYEQGWLKLIENRRKRLIRAHRFDLKYIDPVPVITRHVAKRIGYTALGFSAAFVLALLLAQLDILRPFAAPSAIVAFTATLIALLLRFYMSHEKFVFRTFLGRSPAIQLTVGFGNLRRFHVLLRALIRAIEKAAETRDADTKLYLREEMREHYRLRSEDILTPEDCNNGTDRILAQFDVDL